MKYDDLINIKNEYLDELNNTKEKLYKKQHVDTLLLGIVVTLSSVIIISSWGTLDEELIKKIAWLFISIKKLIPVSLGFYLLTRIVSSIVYGMNYLNKKKIIKLEKKIKDIDMVLKVHENTKTKEKESEIDDIKEENLDLSYPNFQKEIVKVKKIGSLKR